MNTGTRTLRFFTITKGRGKSHALNKTKKTRYSPQYFRQAPNSFTITHTMYVRGTLLVNSQKTV